MPARIVPVYAGSRPFWVFPTPIRDTALAPATAAQVSRFGDLVLELVIETVPSNTADSVELLRQTIENPEPGVPIQLRSLLTSPRAYMAPLQASLRVVSGDAGTVEDGILTIRMRRPRTIQGDGQ